ncbi:glycoside hydrolase family 3 C-terminal domain-containing protein [Streptomyces sp. NPDC126499]|uniref:glycoside hydrolase family 3 C-terminal domain-containing protein n=1 Tax=Streptomyces sp. NPDC126499 TaxID=3155314 RepID=UPI00331CCE7F
MSPAPPAFEALRRTAQPRPSRPRDPYVTAHDDDLDALLARLTPDERIAMLHQYAPAVPRLGLAAFRTGQEALHGVAWMGPATVFPQAVGLGATWNPELVRRIGDAVAREARAMRARDDRVGLNVWAPTVNLLRHPLWGRNEEGYAEDPTLTSAMAVAYTRGLRGDHPVFWRTAPVLKHWLAHNNETDRATSSASVRPRVLHEYDLRAFRGAVEAGAVAGVMPAYNLVNGRPNHLSPYLREHLRAWTERELLVCSDAGAPTNLVDLQHYADDHEEAVAAALLAGVDSFTDHGTDPEPIVTRLRGALKRGLIRQEDVDRAVRRQLAVRAALGEFTARPEPAVTQGAFDTPGHRALAQEAAEQAVVLLANRPCPGDTEPLLPFPSGVRIAVVGPLADECKLDWYSGALLHRATPLDALRAHYGADRVRHADGADRIRLRTASGARLRVPASGAPDEVRGATGALDPALLTGRTDLPPLTADAEGTVFALTDWGGGVLTLRAPDGRFLSVADDGLVRASADQPGGWVVQETFRFEAPAGEDGHGAHGTQGALGGHGGHGAGHLLRHIGTGGYVSVAADGVKVAADRESAEILTVELVESGAEAVARAAAGADRVVVVAGNDPHVNGRETEDRGTLDLPPQQDRLWRAALAANPRTALVLVSSYPYAVPAAARALPALLWTAHGGQAAGTALTRVLTGAVSPAGRLPQTWYAADADLPGLLDYDVIGGRQTYLYFDGTPLFPFGHGLSYTSFGYGELTARLDGDVVRVSFRVTNTGAVASDEVAQVYVRAVAPSVPRPHRELVAHRRLPLAPGAAEELSFDVPLSELGFWDVVHGRWTVESGPYEFAVGASSADLRATARVDLGGGRPGPRPVTRRPLDAVAYDEQDGTEIVDLSRVAGDCVTPLAPARDGQLLFRNCAFGDGATEVAIDVAAEEPGLVELFLEAGGARTLLAAIEVPATGGRYAYDTLTAAVLARGTGDLRVRLRGAVRLARVAFSG